MSEKYSHSCSVPKEKVVYKLLLYCFLFPSKALIDPCNAIVGKELIPLQYENLEYEDPWLLYSQSNNKFPKPIVLLCGFKGVVHSQTNVRQLSEDICAIRKWVQSVMR